jgi:CIC family chloride channel protein
MRAGEQAPLDRDTSPLDRLDAGFGRFLIAIALVGLGAALFAVAFRRALAWWYDTAFHASNVVDAIAGLPPWLRFVVPLAGGLTAGAISWLRSSRGQNVSNVMEAIALGHVRLSLRATLSRVAASWAAIGGGLSIGREGPLIEFGGSLGASIGRALTSDRRTRVLIAAGTAAGFAAAYNTPLAAVLFVLETMAGVAALEVVLPVMGATALATVLTRALVGGGPIYGQREFAFGQPIELLTYGALGLIAALAAIGFKGVLTVGERLFERSAIPQPARSAIGGAIVGALAMWLPAVAGNGYEPLNTVLNQPLPIAFIATLVLVKVIATSASVGSGIPGGIFTPMLLVGGAVGTLWAHAVAAIGGPPIANEGSYALVGMAATAAASTYAPLTAAVMIFEVSGDYPIVIPLILATSLAVAASRAFRSDSVYNSELRRRGLGWVMTLDGRRVENPGTGTVEPQNPEPRTRNPEPRNPEPH